MGPAWEFQPFYQMESNSCRADGVSAASPNHAQTSSTTTRCIQQRARCRLNWVLEAPGALLFLSRFLPYPFAEDASADGSAHRCDNATFEDSLRQLQSKLDRDSVHSQRNITDAACMELHIAAVDDALLQLRSSLAKQPKLRGEKAKGVLTMLCL